MKNVHIFYILNAILIMISAGIWVMLIYDRYSNDYFIVKDCILDSEYVSVKYDSNDDNDNNNDNNDNNDLQYIKMESVDYNNDYDTKNNAVQKYLLINNGNKSRNNSISSFDYKNDIVQKYLLVNNGNRSRNNSINYSRNNSITSLDYNENNINCSSDINNDQRDRRFKKYVRKYSTDNFLLDELLPNLHYLGEKMNLLKSRDENDFKVGKEAEKEVGKEGVKEVGKEVVKEVVLETILERKSRDSSNNYSENSENSKNSKNSEKNSEKKLKTNSEKNSEKLKTIEVVSDKREIYPLCIALFIIMFCSVFQASFFAFVTSTVEGRDIEQILYFDRLFADLLGRPLARFSRPSFLQVNVVCVLICVYIV